jgi:hypothetical protein
MAAQKCFTEIISGYHYLYKTYPHLVAVNYNTHICCVAYIMEYSKLMIILTKHSGVWRREIMGGRFNRDQAMK